MTRPEGANQRDPPPFRTVVVKVGGSLYDLPDLGPRLVRYLAEVRHAFVVPGGGGLADAVRQLDRQHGLGEETAHWLALDALAIAGRFLARLIPGGALTADPGEAQRLCRHGGVPVLDARRFAEQDESKPGALPHTWQVTSDSLAARLAIVCDARRLVLLKSVSLREPVDWVEASRDGVVDGWFPEVLKGGGLSVEVVDLRAARADQSAPPTDALPMV